MLPDFFIIGAQKAGSTYLVQCLADHPQIYMPLVEIPFVESGKFDDDRLKTFSDKFSAAAEGQTVGVKRANVLGHSECAERMHELLPEVRLIAILRHPIERTVSGYFHYMASGFVPIAPVNEGLFRLLDGAYGDYPRAREIIDFSLYGKHLAEFGRIFTPQRIHITLLDDVKRNAALELERLYQFVGVEPSFRPNSQQRRPMQSTYSLTRLRLRQPLDRLCREPTSRRTSQIYRQDPLAKMLKRTNSLVDRWVWSRVFQTPAPELSAELICRLLELFRDDVQRLENQLSRSLASWMEAPTRART